MEPKRMYIGTKMMAARPSRHSHAPVVRLLEESFGENAQTFGFLSRRKELRYHKSAEQTRYKKGDVVNRAPDTVVVVKASVSTAVFSV